MWPIDWAHYPKGVHEALIETLHIAKLMLVSARSVNSLVWALLFVAIFGPGALAGTMAIALRSIGFVGKLFGEALMLVAIFSVVIVAEVAVTYIRKKFI